MTSGANCNDIRRQLLLYALGLGAVEAGRLWFLERMLATGLYPGHQQEPFAARELAPPFGYIYRNSIAVNDQMADILRPHAERTSLEGDRYTLVFEKLDILTALNIAYYEGSVGSQEWYWKNMVAFRCEHREPRRQIIQEIEDSLTTMEEASPFVTCNLFGRTKKRCPQMVLALKHLMSRVKSTAYS